MNTFSDKDKQQLKDKGIVQEKVLSQIATFKEGIPFVNLHKAAIVGDGIRRFTDDEEQSLMKTFDAKKNECSLLKFVPASGAASRMFKAFFNFLEVYQPNKETLENYFKRTNDKDLKFFSDHLKKLPFYEIIQERINLKTTNPGEELYAFIHEMLSEEALNYGFYPKGLLPFHNYGDFVSTPFEEHLKEASLYSCTNGNAQLHFTISEQHGEMFNTEFDTIKERVSKETNSSFNVRYSYQKSETDTIAVGMGNTLFRNTDGTLLFRPGGHGALIENLNEQEADLIFIKNIDNVVTTKVLAKIAASKKILAGLLLEIQAKAFAFAHRLYEQQELSPKEIGEVKQFLEAELNVRFASDFKNLDSSQQIEILKNKINRPIRICGMVKNEGEAGGGPFWIQNSKGEISLQIIESAQVNTADAQQMEIFKNSTHFNPVDLVCGVKNYKGEAYNLLDFVDTKQGFITEKTKDGVDLKALELPGLWNGGMAFWNTIFVEVPLVTFNPVKTVNDLLKPAHQV
tara:strand:- start:20035 stop:21576 length:1542 start_codon:yes stop_codon:yes gene_type:complete